MSNPNNDFESKYIDQIFLGTKDQFQDFINNFNRTRSYLYNDQYQWIPEDKISGIDNNCILFWDIKNGHKELPIIKIESLPKGRTLLRIFFGSTDSSDPKYYWELLEQELIRFEWIEIPGSSHNKNIQSIRPSTLKKYGEIFSIYIKMQGESLSLYYEGAYTFPAVLMEDLKDRVLSETQYRRVSKRTLRRIVNLGNNGELY